MVRGKAQSKAHLVVCDKECPEETVLLRGLAETDLLHAETGVGRRVGPSEVVAQKVVAVHFGLEAGDVAIAEVLTELIDLL